MSYKTCAKLLILDWPRRIGQTVSVSQPDQADMGAHVQLHEQLEL